MLILCACDNNKLAPVNIDDPLLDFWSNRQVIDNEIILFDRVDGLVTDEHSICFDHDNMFTERKNSGCCGTPPVSYTNDMGQWQKTNSKLDITVAYWEAPLNMHGKWLRLMQAINVLNLLMRFITH